MHQTHFPSYTATTWPLSLRTTWRGRGIQDHLNSSPTMKLLARPLAHPIRNLFIFWIGWKLILLLIAACSPGPGYDTSASLLSPTGTRNRELPNAFRYLVNKLTKWDAIYFVKVATRGYLFEQEWFLGWGFTRAIALCTGGKHSLHALPQITDTSSVGESRHSFL